MISLNLRMALSSLLTEALSEVAQGPQPPLKCRSGVSLAVPGIHTDSVDTINVTILESASGWNAAIWRKIPRTTER